MRKNYNTLTSEGRHRNERFSQKKGNKVLPGAEGGSDKKPDYLTELSGLKRLKREINCRSGSKASSAKGTSYSFFVQWHLTDRCNLKCRHCYQSVVVPEMTSTEIYRAIDNVSDAIQCWAAEYGIKTSPSIHFTGGEPLLRRDLFDILKNAHQHGFSISLLSNGTLVTDELARLISNSPVNDVQVSLEGLESIHDSIRGTGSFWQALKGIENLVSHDIDTSINLTLSRINMEQITELVPVAREVGVRNITFSRLVACGRGEELTGAMPTPQELANLYAHLRKFKKGRVKVTSRDPLAVVAEMEEEVPQTDFPAGGCAAGVFGITIATDGSIMPCRRMNLTIGNIKNESFRQLWAESPVLWSLRRRQCYHDGCQSCYYWAVCRGCRAIALAQARAEGKDDFLGPDPQCSYYRPRK